jgi:hypothetical protein
VERKPIVKYMYDHLLKDYLLPKAIPQYPEEDS